MDSTRLWLYLQALSGGAVGASAPHNLREQKSKGAQVYLHGMSINL